MQDPDRQALRQSAWRQMALARGTAARLLQPIASAYGWLVELRHRQVDLVDAAALLAAGFGNVGDDFGDALDAGGVGD